MTVENVMALIFLGAAALSTLTIMWMDFGVFENIAVRLTAYIISRIERLEKEDI